MNLLLAALGPKPEPAHPEMLSTTLVEGAGMQRSPHAVEMLDNVEIQRRVWALVLANVDGRNSACEA